MVQTNENHAEFFHQKGLKSTRPRNLVLSILMHNDGILTAEEIYKELAVHDENINFSTVYRILELFADKGIIEKSNFPGSQKRVFSLKAREHAHRLICLGCHKIISLDHCPLSSFEHDVEKSTQFMIVGHNLELFGYCKDCKKKLQKSKSRHVKEG